uniref:Uncharacterized protein n=1 Tax=Arundo donax TaxID=35708 RepID=A0A0A9E4I7_ARUDO
MGLPAMLVGPAACRAYANHDSRGVGPRLPHLLCLTGIFFPKHDRSEHPAIHPSIHTTSSSSTSPPRRASPSCTALCLAAPPQAPLRLNVRHLGAPPSPSVGLERTTPSSPARAPLSLRLHVVRAKRATTLVPTTHLAAGCRAPTTSLPRRGPKALPIWPTSARDHRVAVRASRKRRWARRGGRVGWAATRAWAGRVRRRRGGRS